MKRIYWDNSATTPVDPEVVEAFLKAYENGLISEPLFQQLKPFFDFRNSLIHRYWTIDDSRLIDNVMRGRGDFDRFIEEIETYTSRLDRA